MEFVCRDPNAVVRGANVRATLDACSFDTGFGQRLAQKHQLWTARMKPDSYLPLQRWLDALKEIQFSIGPATLRKVGRAIVEHADFPPTFPTTESILEAIDAIYQMNHRGDVGRYRVERDGRDIVIHCETPYPRILERGVIEGICYNPRKGGPRPFNIEYVEGPPAGDLTCTMRVRFPD